MSTPLGNNTVLSVVVSRVVGVSQKVQITRVRVRGAAPFLGLHIDRDSKGNPVPGADERPVWSHNPDRVMVWLCDGFRSRFNQLRSRRTRTVDGVESPLSDRPDVRGQTQARAECSWLAALPDRVLQAPAATPATTPPSPTPPTPPRCRHEPQRNGCGTDKPVLYHTRVALTTQTYWSVVLRYSPTHHP